jgi:hypothetical protein
MNRTVPFVTANWFLLKSAKPLTFTAATILVAHTERESYPL